MKVLVPEFENRDSRRTLTQLFTADIKQVNFYEAKKGALLGDHYHKETTEYFYITRGSLMMNERILSKGSLFVVYPEETHVIECLTDVNMFSFLSKAFTKEDPDIWKKS